MKSYILLFVTITSIFYNFSFSQEWNVFHQEEGFIFSYQYSECHFDDIPDQSWAIIKVENTNDFHAELQFYYHQYLNGECFNCDQKDQETLKIVEVPAQNSVQGKCRFKSRRTSLEVFHKFLVFEGRELTDLKIADLNFKEITE